MKLNINNTIKSIRKFLPNLVLILSALFLVSCNPTIESLEFDVAEEGSKEDESFPNAFFSYTAEEAFYQFTFANGSSSASSFEWNFGDGTEVLTERLPSISVNAVEQVGLYEFPIIDEVATYTVTLTAIDANGLSDTFSKEITITPDADFVIPGSQYDDFNELTDVVDTSNSVVTVHSFSIEQDSKDNLAANSLDGVNTSGDGFKWTAEDADGDGEFVIYDLGGAQDLGIVSIAFQNKALESYVFQISTSSTGTDEADFIVNHPLSGASDYEYIEADAEHSFVDFDLSTTGTKYVKLTVFGRVKTTDVGSITDLTTQRSSDWSNVNEVRIFANK